MKTLTLIGALSLALGTALPGAATAATAIPDGGARIRSGPSGDVCRQARPVAAAGLSWASVGDTWQRLEPQPQAMSEAAVSGLETLLRCAKDDGLRTQLILHDAPQWASGRASVSNDPPTPANVGAYADFLRRLATRLGPLVDAWTPWNEPNLNMFWAPPQDPARYVALQRAAYTALKGADPTALVTTAPVVGTPTSNSSNNAWDYLRAAYAAGLKGSADVIGFNFYARTAPEGTATDAWGRPAPWALTSQPYLRALLDRFDPGIPVWIMETSYSTCLSCTSANKVTEAQQADYLTRIFDYRRRYLQGVTDRVFWYETQDSGTDVNDWYQNQGLLRADGTPKPAYGALAGLRVPVPDGAPGGGGGGGATTPVIPAPTLPPRAARSSLPASASVITRIGRVRVGIGRLKVTLRGGRLTVRTRVTLSRGRGVVAVSGFRGKRWRSIATARLARSSTVRLTFPDLGYVGIRVLAKPAGRASWTVSRIVRVRVPKTR